MNLHDILVLAVGLALLLPGVLLILVVIVGTLRMATGAVLGRIRHASDDQAIGDAPAWLPETELVPAWLIDQWVADCAAAGCDDCSGRTQRRANARDNAPAEFAAIAATMPDLAHIDIQRLEALYIAPEVRQ